MTRILVKGESKYRITLTKDGIECTTSELYPNMQDEINTLMKTEELLRSMYSSAQDMREWLKANDSLELQDKIWIVRKLDEKAMDEFTSKGAVTVTRKIPIWFDWRTM